MSLSLFSYPATVAWVDDDSLFLSAITQLFKSRSLLTFDSPEKILQFFGKYQSVLQKTNFIRGYTEGEDYEMLNHMPVDLNFAALAQLHQNDERAQEISVLITDYDMPGMNGLDLCRKVNELPMKKILLTGAADYQQAVTAFNEGLIDCFLQKDSPTLADDLLFHVGRLSQQYFIEHSKPLLGHLEADYLLPLSDPVFVQFFKEWCEENEIREYYLIDKHGNFLLIDKTNKQSYFIIHTERTLNNFIDLHSDETGSESFIDVTKQREKIPFFGAGVESWELEPFQWANCFYEPQILVGREKYYWMVTR